jgi:hypothetical protein
MSDQPDLFNRDTVKHVRGSATSREAGESISPITGRLRAQVFEMIVSNGGDGLTDEEISLRLGLNPSTARPRRIELVEAGKVRDSGRTRRTVSGRAAVVWIAV